MDKILFQKFFEVPCSYIQVACTKKNFKHEIWKVNNINEYDT